jgi:TonB family protein
MNLKTGLSLLFIAVPMVASTVCEAARVHGRVARHHHAATTSAHQGAKPYGAGLNEEQSLRALGSEIARKLGAKIQQEDYPEEARREGWSGTTWVDVSVGSDGKIKELAVQQSSGFTILDEQAIRMVDRISLWWIPQRLRNREVKVAVPVAFYVLDKAEAPWISADVFAGILADRVYLPASHCRNTNELDPDLIAALAVDLMPPQPPEPDPTLASWTAGHALR